MKQTRKLVVFSAAISVQEDSLFGNVQMGDSDYFKKRVRAKSLN
jgi:hypothetical protein